MWEVACGMWLRLQPNNGRQLAANWPSAVWDWQLSSGYFRVPTRQTQYSCLTVYITGAHIYFWRLAGATGNADVGKSPSACPFTCPFTFLFAFLFAFLSLPILGPPHCLSHLDESTVSLAALIIS